MDNRLNFNERLEMRDEINIKKGKEGGAIVDKIGLKGQLHLVLRDKEGNIKEERLIENTITNVGKAEIAALMVADVGGTSFDYIAIGTGTPTATALGGEITSGGGQRRGGADVTGSRVTTTTTNDTAQWVTTFSFTASFAVTEEGIFNAASGGTMLASQSFAALNVVNGDTLQITHKIQVS